MDSATRCYSGADIDKKRINSSALRARCVDSATRCYSGADTNNSTNPPAGVDNSIGIQYLSIIASIQHKRIILTYKHMHATHSTYISNVCDFFGITKYIAAKFSRLRSGFSTRPQLHFLRLFQPLKKYQSCIGNKPNKALRIDAIPRDDEIQI